MNMYSEKQKFTRITLDQSDLHIVWEVPYEDISGGDMMQAIRTLMIGMTFNDRAVESSMASYISEHSNEYEVIEIEEKPIETDEQYND